MEKCKGTESQGVTEGRVGSSSGHPFICRSSLGRNYALVKGGWVNFRSYAPPHRTLPYREQPAGSLGALGWMASPICGSLCSLQLLPLLISITFFSLQTFPSSRLGWHAVQPCPGGWCWPQPRGAEWHFGAQK